MLPTPNINLIEQVVNADNLNAAWKRVRKNKGAAGIDGLPMGNFTRYLRSSGARLIEEIRKGRYQPYPVQQVFIEKAGGGLRRLGIPTVLDRTTSHCTSHHTDIRPPLFRIQLRVSPKPFATPSAKSGSEIP